MSQPDLYPVPPDFAASARLKRDDYERLYAQSVREPDAFWGQVEQRLEWMKAPTQVKDVSYRLDEETKREVDRLFDRLVAAAES